MAIIYPRCEQKEGGKDYALSAKGYLLPCCWCDTITPEKDEELLSCLDHTYILVKMNR